MVRTHAIQALEERVVLNAAPVAQDDQLRIEPGETALISTAFLTNNDQDADEDALNPAAHSFKTAQGVVVNFDAEGRFTYHAPQGFVGTDTFKYWVDDGQEMSNAATVHIRVGNRAPTAAADAFTVVSGETLHFDEPALTVNDTDADGDSIEFAGLRNRTAHGSLTWHADGSFDYVSDPGYVGVDTFRYQITDGESISYGNVTIQVEAPNQAPTPGNDDVGDVSQGQTATGNVLANDGDPENDDLTVDAFQGAVDGGYLTLSTNGDFTFTAATDYLGAGSFEYTVRDAEGDAATAMLSWNVVNLPPTPQHDPSGDVVSDQTLSGNVLSNDTDPENDSLAVDSFYGAVGGGYLSLNADGSFTFTAGNSTVGAGSFDYTVRDPQGNTAGATLSWNILNAAPTAQNDSTGDVFEGYTVYGNVLSNDTDPENNPLTVDYFSGAVGGGYLTLNTDGSYAFSAGAAGPGGFDYTVRDSAGNPAVATLSWNVLNQAPTPQNDSAGDVVTGESASGNVLSNDTDPENNTLSVDAFTGNVGGGHLTLNADGSYTFTAGPSATGGGSFDYTVRDTAGNSAVATLSWNVVAPPLPPVPTVSFGGATDANEGSGVAATAYLTSGAPATYFISWGDGTFDSGSFDGYLTIDLSTHVYRDDGPSQGNGTPSDATAISITVDDGLNAQVGGSHGITVYNRVPTVTVDQVSPVNEGDTFTISGTVNDDGLDDALSVSIVWKGQTYTRNNLRNGDTFSFENLEAGDDDASSAASDDYQVTVTVSDDDGQSGETPTTVTVDNVVPELDVDAVSGTYDEDPEGQVTISGTVYDPADTVTVYLKINGVVQDSRQVAPGGGAFSFTFLFDDDDTEAEGDGMDGPTGEFAFELVAEDDDQGTATGSGGSITVKNVPPQFTQEGYDLGELHECDGITLPEPTVDYTDPGTDVFDPSWTYDSDPYAPGTHTVTYTITDDDGESDSTDFTYTIVACPTHYRLEYLEDIDEDTGHRKTEVSAGDDSFGTAIPGGDFTQDADGVLANDTMSVFKEIRHIGKRYIVVESFDHGDPELPGDWVIGQTVDENYDEPYCEWVSDDEAEPDYNLSVDDQSDDIDTVTLNHDGSFTITFKNEEDVPEDFDGSTWFDYTLTGSGDDCGCDGEGGGGEGSPEPKKVTIETAKIDIDTDSDNTGDVSGSDEEDRVEDLASTTAPRDRYGKRIFVNKDDDNKNGVVDADETTADASENDFAEIHLKVPALPAKYNNAELWIGKDPNLTLWGDAQKTALTAIAGGPQEVPGEPGWYRWVGSANFPTNLTVFAEGTDLSGNKPSKVFFRLVEAGETHMNAKVRDTVEINVETRVYPLMDQGVDWQKQLTKDWKGFEVPAGWWMDKALIDYITNPNVQGSLATIFPDQNTHATKDGLDAKSTANLAASIGNGFTLAFNYEFDRTRGDGTGFVKANHPQKGELDKLSMVANSGVKFGGIEAAILDVKTMVERVTNGGLTGIDAFNPSMGNAIDDAGQVSFPWLDPNAKDEVETVNKLLNGVVYGGEERLMTFNPNGEPQTAGAYFDVLNAAYNIAAAAPATSRMEIIVDATGITIKVNNTVMYSDIYRGTAITALELQAHWGSGVIFSNLTLT
jgi:hypothetical protein